MTDIDKLNQELTATKNDVEVQKLKLKNEKNNVKMIETDLKLRFKELIDSQPLYSNNRDIFNQFYEELFSSKKIHKSFNKSSIQSNNVDSQMPTTF